LSPLPPPPNFSLSPLSFSKRKALETSFPQPVWSKVGKYLSPPQRLPLGIPMKIAIIEKQEAPYERWEEGKGGSLTLFSLSPSHRAPRAPFSFFPASSQHKEASAEDRRKGRKVR